MNKTRALLFSALFLAQHHCIAADYFAGCTAYQKPTAHKFEVKYSESSMLELKYFMTRKEPGGVSNYTCSINARRGEVGSSWVDNKAERKTEIVIKDVGKVTSEIKSRVIKLDLSGIDPTVCGNTGPAQVVMLYRHSSQCKIKSEAL